MKKLLMSVSFIALSSISAVSAADLPSKKTAPLAPVGTTYNWAGPYLGAQAGYTVSSQITGTLSSYSAYLPEAKGGFGGIYGGYNFQSGAVVYGGELDFALANVEDTKSYVSGTTSAKFKTSQSWVGSARLRLGYAFNNILLFTTAGLATSDGKISVAIASPTLNSSGSATKDLLGLAIGGGLEYGISNNLTTKLEYRYTTYQTVSVGTGKIGFDTHDVRAGVAYKF